MVATPIAKPPPRASTRRTMCPLPRQCPHCRGGRLKKTRVVSQYQTEIPRQVIYRQFDVEVGVCRDCGHSVEGRHELMTSTARGAASSQLGANVHALLAIMNKQCGLSYGKCVNLLATAYEGLKVSRAACARSLAPHGQRVSSGRPRTNSPRGSRFPSA